jgi:hypothetical protein
MIQFTTWPGHVPHRESGPRLGGYLYCISVAGRDWGPEPRQEGHILSSQYDTLSAADAVLSGHLQFCLGLREGVNFQT